GLAPGHIRIMAMRARQRARRMLESIGAAAGLLLPRGALRRLGLRVNAAGRRALPLRSAAGGLPAESAAMLSGTGLMIVGLAAALALVNPAGSLGDASGHPRTTPQDRAALALAAPLQAPPPAAAVRPAGPGARSASPRPRGGNPISVLPGIPSAPGEP